MTGAYGGLAGNSIRMHPCGPMQRIVSPELVDQVSVDPTLVAESMADLAWLNRYLGGTATIQSQLRRLLAGDRVKRLRVLDVGAGGGDILVALGHWCERRGISFAAVALDISRATAGIAAATVASRGYRGTIRVVCGDARELPFADSGFDVAISSTFLHHLDPEDVVISLREMRRVSSLGIVVSDLRRGIGGLLGAWTLVWTVWRRHRYTRHDAIASMRAAYTMAEVRELAERAGLEPAIEPHLWFRWALRWRRSG